MDEQDKTLARAESEIVKAAVALIRQTLEGDAILEALVKEDRVALADYWLTLKNAVNEFWEVA